MIREVVLIILTLLIADSTGNQKPRLLRENQQLNTALIDCLKEMIESSQNIKLKIAVQNSEEHNILTSEFLKNLLAPVVINVTEHHQRQGLDTRQPANMALILDDNPKPTEILNNTLWNADTRFFLILENNTSLNDIFQQFWADKVIHVYALIEQNSIISVYAFEPYKPGECDSIEIKIIDEWENGRFTRNGMSTIINNTRIKNFNGCPVNVSVVDVKPNVMFKDECNCKSARHIDGIEGKVLIEIAKKLNMNATYVIPLDGIGWGWIRPSPAGVVGDVYTGRSDFGFGLLAPIIERYENLDLTEPYNGDECITYGVPRGAAAKNPDWLDLLISEFPYRTWMYILVAFILTAISLGVVIKISKEEISRGVIIPLYLFGIALGVPSRSSPGLILRTLYISWVWCCFVLTVAYQASMGSKLTVKKIDKEIDTFKELLVSKLKLTGYNNMLRLLQYDDNEGEIREMEKIFVVTDFDIDEAVNQIAEHREIAHVRHTTTFLYYALINPKAKGEVHVIKDCLYTYYPSFVMKKYSPLLRRVNRIIRNLKEVGIVQYWRSKYIWTLPHHPEGFVKLSTDHMKGLFYIVLIGEAVSIISVILEIVFSAFVKRWRRVRQYFGNSTGDKGFFIPSEATIRRHQV